MKKRFATLPTQKHRKNAAKEAASLNPVDLEPNEEGIYLPANMENLRPGINISLQQYNRLSQDGRPKDQPRNIPLYRAYRRPVVVEVLILIGVGTVEAARFLVPVLVKAIYLTAYGVAFVIYYLALGLFDVLKEIVELSLKKPGRQVDKEDNVTFEGDKSTASNVYQSIQINGKAKNVTINQQNKM
jgi:hypothetical protein